MKKFFTKLITNTTDYALLIILFYSAITGVQSLMGLTAAAYWIVMALAFFVGPLIYILSYATKSAKDEESRRRMLEIIGGIAKKNNPFSRFVGWLKLILICCLLAYSGWIFTGVCYALISLYFRLLISLARDNVIQLQIAGI